MTEVLIRRFVPDAANVRSPAVRERYGVLSGAVGIACNLFLFALKLVIGMLTASISITADAFNNLSDGLSCVISIAGFKVAGKEPDAKHPFGYGRTEYVAGLIVSFLIVIVGVEFLKTSVERIFHPSAVRFSGVLLAILAVSMLVKLWMGFFNQKIGKRIDSPTLMAARQDSVNDVITTGVVVLGMLAGRLTALPVDGYVGLAVALFILWAGVGVARDTLDPLLGQPADPAVAQSILDIALSYELILGAHDLIIHSYGAGRSLASLHAEVRSDVNLVAAHEVIDEAETRIRQQTGVYAVIHMDPIDVNDEHVRTLREQVQGALAAIDKQLSMHDFRVVDGEKQINLVFDVVVPFSYDSDGKRNLMTTMRNEIKKIDERYNLVVTFDHQM